MKSAREPVGLDQAIGQRIRLRRLELAMSQETLAGRLGLTFQQLQKYEKGINRVAASRLFEIAKHLDVPPSYLLTGSADDTGAVTESGAQPVMSMPGLARLASDFSQIKDARVRRLVVDLVSTLAQMNDGEDEKPVRAPPSKARRDTRRSAD